MYWLVQHKVQEEADFGHNLVPGSHPSAPNTSSVSGFASSCSFLLSDSAPQGQTLVITISSAMKTSWICPLTSLEIPLALACQVLHSASAEAEIGCLGCEATKGRIPCTWHGSFLPETIVRCLRNCSLKAQSGRALAMCMEKVSLLCLSNMGHEKKNKDRILQSS